jgi:hypothetical protein
MDLTNNVSFLQKIDTTVKTIMKDGKINQFDIPEILLLLTELVTMSETSNVNTKVTIEQLENSINVLYEYIMEHYKLFPDDAEEKESFNRLFTTCTKLILFQPNITKSCKSLFSCIV